MNLLDIKNVTQIDPKRFNQFVSRFLKISDPNNVAIVDRLCIYLEEWLTLVCCLTDSDREATLTFIKPQLEDYAKELETQKPDISGFLCLVLIVCDMRYVTCCSKFFDLQSGETLEELPAPSVTMITCDIAALILRKEPNYGQHSSEGPITQ